MDEVNEIGEFDAELGARCRVARKIAGLTLRAVGIALADVPGSDPTAMSERERGERPWTARQLHAVAGLYGVDVATLLDGVTAAQPIAL